MCRLSSIRQPKNPSKSRYSLSRSTLKPLLVRSRSRLFSGGRGLSARGLNILMSKIRKFWQQIHKIFKIFFITFFMMVYMYLKINEIIEIFEIKIWGEWGVISIISVKKYAHSLHKKIKKRTNSSTHHAQRYNLLTDNLLQQPFRHLNPS